MSPTVTIEYNRNPFPFWNLVALRAGGSYYHRWSVDIRAVQRLRVSVVVLGCDHYGGIRCYRRGG